MSIFLMVSHYFSGKHRFVSILQLGLGSVIELVREFHLNSMLFVVLYVVE